MSAIFEEIVDGVCMEYLVSKRELLSDRRPAYIMPARQAAYYYAKNTGATLKKVAEFFSRDHSTILHGIRQHKKRMAA